MIQSKTRQQTTEADVAVIGSRHTSRHRKRHEGGGPFLRWKKDDEDGRMVVSGGYKMGDDASGCVPVFRMLGCSDAPWFGLGSSGMIWYHR